MRYKSALTLVVIVVGLLLTVGSITAGGQSSAEAREVFSAQTDDGGGGQGYPLTSSRWTEMPIPVCWENPNAATAAQRQLVIDGANVWTDHAAVSFSGWGTCTANADGVRIEWIDIGPNAAGLGNNLDGVQNGVQMNNTFQNWSTSCQDSVAYCIEVIAAHEFGHVLGLAHEHNRPDTPASCTVDPQGTDGDVTVGPWDMESIMNYCSTEWTNAGNLTQGDIDTIRYLYPICTVDESEWCPGTTSDFNGDGYDDLPVGIPGEARGNVYDAGGVTELHGSSSGITAVGNWFWDQESAWTGVAERGDQFAGSLAPGDFNGDGYFDLAVGVPGQADNFPSLQTASGVVHVVDGGSGGLTSTGSDRLRQGTAPIAGVVEAGDLFGAAMVTGDFNADGFHDLVIGSPGESTSTTVDSGEVAVIYGSGSGLISWTSQSFNQDSSGMPGDLGGVESGDHFGAALITGDFDGDGYHDLAIGSPGETLSGEAGVGAVVVMYGSDDGLRSETAESWKQGSGVHGATEAGDSFGAVLAVGDFDDDGSDDLAIGAPGEAIGTENGAGAVTVIYGTTSGLSASGNQGWSQDSGGLPGAAEAGDAFGAALAAGDFDGDGDDDLAIGVPGEAVGALDGAGTVAVLQGGFGGLTSTAATGWSQDSGGVPGAVEAGDFFGHALYAADFNADGRDDLAVGVPGEAIGTIEDAGMAVVLVGSSGGLTGDAGQGWHQDIGFIVESAEVGDWFGATLPFSGRHLGHRTCDGRLATRLITTPGLLTQTTGGPDVIVGTSGDDSIRSFAGNDRICTLAGDDEVTAGAGSDRIFGQAGDDVIDGEDDGDRIWGGSGDDEIRGGHGDDVIRANAGEDVVWGGDGDDRLYGNADDDSLFGELGADRLFGNSGFDDLDGGVGDDSLYGHSDGDIMVGGDGNDLLSGSGGSDLMVGSAGTDTLRGGSGDDVMFGNEGDNDLLVGQSGDDVMSGGPGTGDICRGKSHVNGDSVDGSCEVVRDVP